jgi:hypothetical protein
MRENLHTMTNEYELTNNTIKLTLIYDDHNPAEALMRLQDGRIVEIERPGGHWFGCGPTPELVNLFARFIQRLRWANEGQPDRIITDDSEISKDARQRAEEYLLDVCVNRVGPSNDEFFRAVRSGIDTLMVSWADRFFEPCPHPQCGGEDRKTPKHQ